ncbi:SDR family oxidoreductase [Chryseobacterium sp. T20]|uniref:SDR family oxidoreductase n=1 Tax=Chryseobacterium sp. T20 TaxID=3395375 RepID=UPI0039BC7B28
MNLTNNTVFISGGSAGIGLEIAKKFSASGNKVIINGRDQTRLDNALNLLNNAVGIQGDLSIESERIRISEELKQNHPDLNVVINNAGLAYAYSLAESDETYENARKEINTNYLSIIHFNELLLPNLREKSDAAIVNVTSILSFIPTLTIPTYSTSKAALKAYTQLLRKSLAQTNVRVFELIPPLVNTEFSAGSGGENGIDPKEVADELWIAFEKNQLDVPVGKSKVVYSIFQEAISKLTK